MAIKHNELKTMKKSILFLGKYDESMLILEEKIINISKNSNQNLHTFNCDHPDIIKFQINQYNCEAWGIIGNVKPTFLLKSLISKTKIIIFIINLANQDSIDFLTDGWIPIIDKIDKKLIENQKRILIGTNSPQNHEQIELYKKIHLLMSKLNCKSYFEERLEKDSFVETQNVKITVFSDIINYLKTILTCDESEEGSFNKENSKLIENDEEKDTNNDECTSFTDINYINYKLFKSNTAEVVASPQAKGDVFIKQSIEFQGKAYKITKIGNEVFQDSKITSLSFSDDSDVYSIGDLAFNKSCIHTISIPSSLQKLERNWCGGADFLSQIIVDQNNPVFENRSGVFVFHPKDNSLSSEILFVPRNFNGKFSVLSEYTRIGCYAFYKCRELTEFVFKKPESGLINIDDFSFFNASKLQSVFLESEELRIGICSFGNCLSLSSITFKIAQNVKICYKAFVQCCNLENISIKASSEIKIGDYCFSNALNLQSIIIECDQLSIGKCCFENCNSLDQFTLKNCKEISLGPKQFIGCYNLIKINFQLFSKIKLQANCFDGSCINYIELEGDEVEIDKECFNNCSSLIFVIIKNSNLISISDNAFRGCNNLDTIYFQSNNIIKLGNSCFSELPKLQSIVLNGSNIDIGEFCFKKCKLLNSISFQNMINDQSITNGNINLIQNLVIGNNCFENCDSIKSLCCSKINNIKIGREAFKKCDNFILFSITQSSTVFINDECFAGNASFQLLLIQCNDLHLSDNWIRNCSSLIKVTFEIKQNLVLLPHTFFGCISLSNATFASDNLTISKGSIEISNLESIEVTGKQILITNDCFNEALKLKSIAFSCEKLIIQNNCFNNCYNLSYIALPKTIINIGEKCFNNLQNLNNIFIKNNELIIGNGCFNKFACVEIPENPNIISNKKVSIESDSLIKIGNACFSELFHIQSIDIKGKYVKIAEKCFNKCFSLKAFIISNTAGISIGDNFLSECDNIASLEFLNANYVELSSSEFSSYDNLDRINFKITPSLIYDANDHFNICGETHDTYIVSKKNEDCYYTARELKQEIETKEIQNFFLKRIISLQKANHRCILPIVGFCLKNFKKENFPMVISKHINVHSLGSIDINQFTGLQKYKILLGLTIGMDYLHSLNIYHGNLSLNSIFIDKNCFVYISNFEILININKNINLLFKDDIYSYSLIAYELITGYKFNINTPNCYSMIQSPKIQEFFKRCTSYNFFFMPPFADILQEIKTLDYQKIFGISFQEIDSYLSFYENKESKDRNRLSFVKCENGTEVFHDSNNLSFYLSREDQALHVFGSSNVQGDAFIPEYLESVLTILPNTNCILCVKLDFELVIIGLKYFCYVQNKIKYYFKL